MVLFNTFIFKVFKTVESYTSHSVQTCEFLLKTLRSGNKTLVVPEKAPSVLLSIITYSFEKVIPNLTYYHTY